MYIYEYKLIIFPVLFKSKNINFILIEKLVKFIKFMNLNKKIYNF